MYIATVPLAEPFSTLYHHAPGGTISTLYYHAPGGTILPIHYHAPGGTIFPIIPSCSWRQKRYKRVTPLGSFIFD
jgi:hypothetical protein